MKLKYLVYAIDKEPENNIVLECADLSEMNRYANACKKQGYKVYTEVLTFDTRKDICEETKPCSQCHAKLEDGCKLGFSTVLHKLIMEDDMNKCLDCKVEFEEPECGVINHHEVDTRKEEPSCVCPSCGSSDWEKMKLCPSCGNHWITSDRDFCSMCIIDTNWCIDMVQRLTGASWEQTIALIDYVIEKGKR